MLALYIAFSRSFDYPYWTMMVVYILALDSSGAMRQKWAYMLVGSVCGALIGVFIAFEMATSQVAMLLTLFFAMALAGFFALRDRLPSFYGFMIGGVTCLLVAMPGLTTPDMVLLRAIHRIQDIVVGACALFLVDTLIAPSSAAQSVRQIVFSWLGSLREVTVAVLRGLPPDDKAFSAVLGKMSQIDPLASYLPFDSVSFGARRRRAAEIVRTRGLRTLRILSTLRDIDAHLRDGRLGTGGAVAPLDMTTRQALADWIEGGATRDHARAIYHRFRVADGTSRKVGSDGDAGRDESEAAVSVPDRETWVRTLHQLQLRQLRRLFAAWWLIGIAQRSLASRRPLRLRLPDGFSATPSTLAPLDVGYALRVITGLLCHFGTFSLLWLTFGWVSGYAAFGMLLSSIFFVVSGRAPSPVAVIVKVSRIVAVAMIVVGIYVCAILPYTSAFPTVAIALFPALFVLGIFVPNPPNVLFAVLPMAMLRLGNNGPGVDLPALINSAMGLAIGLCSALFWMVLLVRLPAGGVARRLIREGWLDLLDLLKALNRPRADVSREEARSYGWRMLDRLVVLFQQFAASSPAQQRLIVVETLRQVRAGDAAFTAGLGPLTYAPRQGAASGNAVVGSNVADSRAVHEAAVRPLWRQRAGARGAEGAARTAEQANASATERAAAWLTATQSVRPAAPSLDGRQETEFVGVATPDAASRSSEAATEAVTRPYAWIDARLGGQRQVERRAADGATEGDADMDTVVRHAAPDAIDCALADLRLALYPDAMAPGVTRRGETA